MSTLTVAVTPAEIEYQFQHYDDNQGAVITITTSVFFALAVTMVILRLIARRIKHTAWQLDDYMIGVALILAAGCFAEAILAVQYGAGQHTLKVGIPNIVKSLQVLLALQITYNLALVAIKTSILLLYKSIFTLNARAFRIAWYIVLAYVLACGVVNVTVCLTQCTPTRYAWEAPLGTPGRCVDLRGDEIGTGVAVTAADIFLLLLPMPTLWALKVKLVQKLQLSGIFFLGLLATTASAVRLSYLVKVSSSVDFTFIEVDPLVWSLLEVDLGIVCACIPTLPPLMKRSKPRSGFSDSGQTGLFGGRTLTGSIKSLFTFGSRSTSYGSGNHSRTGYSKDEGGRFNHRHSGSAVEMT